MNEKQRTKNNIHDNTGYLTLGIYYELEENKTLFYDIIRHGVSNEY
jgi:hypothetical protein